MYPIFRVAKEIFVHRGKPRLEVGEVHVSHLRCWPIDIDIFGEMNNGRFLTIFDLGRIIMFKRLGVLPEMKRRGWYGTVAGTAIRYQRRVTVFQKIALHTRVIGWDQRFTYIEHALWRGEECVAQAVLRTAVTSGRGIVPTLELSESLDYPPESPPLPDWVQAWADAEAKRPWPPALGAS